MNNGPRIRDEGQDARDAKQGGANPAPTKAPLARREGSPAAYATSGMESALGKLADKAHKC